VRLRPSADGAATIPCFAGDAEKPGVVVSRVSIAPSSPPALKPIQRSTDLQSPKDDLAPQKHTFDRVFDQGTAQQQVYEEVCGFGLP
jgi:hypothetical protein